jgi:hypothetical protein
MATSSITIVLISLVLALIPLTLYLSKPSIPSIPNATPHFPLIGNSVHFAINPVKYLLEQRAKHGDVFLVDLGVFKVVFFLGPEGTNAIFKGTDRGGIGFLAAMTFIFGQPLIKGTFIFLRRVIQVLQFLIGPR